MYNRFTLLFKVLTLFGLIILMLIPMVMIKGIIEGREDYQNEVIHSVAESSSYAQTIIGPVMVIPYTQYAIEVRGQQKYEVSHHFVKYELPQELDIDGNADVSSRHIGIYQAQIYQTDLVFNGHFNPASIEDLVNNDNIVLQQPYLVVLISDPRGIMQVPLMEVDGNKIQFEPGINNSGFYKGKGIHAKLEINQIVANKTNFNFSLKLQGTKELSIVPVGRSSAYQLKGNWPHPNFIGYTLPATREIDTNGFNAKWLSSWYANNINTSFNKTIDVSDEYQKLCDYSIFQCFPMFKTNFVETVDQYQMTERAIKYDILFIALTFVCFFIFELLKQFRIHPMQYLLVGMALTLFYLLLLALSEHIGFLFAYISGASACILLIGIYLSSVLRSIKWAFGFMLFLGLLYTALYFVMSADGNALLLGSAVLFVILGSMMILTRKIDWYKVAQSSSQNKTITKKVV